MVEEAIRELYPLKKVTAVFQPHLFSRTRDFFDDFAEALSRLDELVLLPIYPARELPIEGVTSDALIEKVNSSKKSVLSPADAVDLVAYSDYDVILTMGAGNIDRIVLPLKNRLENE